MRRYAWRQAARAAAFWVAVALAAAHAGAPVPTDGDDPSCAGAGGAGVQVLPLPPRPCWAEAGAAAARRWSLTVLTRRAMQQISFRGQLQETPPFRAPLPVDRKRLCDGSQSGGGQCHYGVTRSLLRGAEQIGLDLTFNPPNASLYGDVIWALAGPGACAEAARAKSARPAGQVFVIAGPQTPDVHACGDVDLFIVPSPWVKDLLLEGLGPHDVPTPAERIVSLHAGVDTDFWRPSAPWGSTSRRKILLYDKSRVSDGSISRWWPARTARTSPNSPVRSDSAPSAPPLPAPHG
jgi:hypothetical protein